MAMDAHEIERMIKEGIPDAKVTIRDLAGDGEHYAAEVAWPGVGINCNACPVNNSYMQDLGPLRSYYAGLARPG